MLTSSSVTLNKLLELLQGWLRKETEFLRGKIGKRRRCNEGETVKIVLYVKGGQI